MIGATVLIMEQEKVTTETCNHAMTISDTENHLSNFLNQKYI